MTSNRLWCTKNGSGLLRSIVSQYAYMNLKTIKSIMLAGLRQNLNSGTSPPPPNRKEFYRFDCNFHWNLHHHLKQTYLRISRTLCAYVSQKESLMCNLTKRVSWLNYIHLVSHTTVSPCAAQYLNTLSGSQIINELLRDSEIVYVDDVERAAWEAFAICSNALLRHSFRRI